MVDNFELIKSMFYFNEANDMFFHCQIVQRAKDHKGEKVREGAIKTYFIRSAEHLMRVKDEIILLCEHYKARAYINVAGKDFSALQSLMLVKLASDIHQGLVRNPRKCLNSAAGELKSRMPKWVVDIDDISMMNVIADKLFELYAEAWKRKGSDISVKALKEVGYDYIYAQIPTKQGIHLIVKPFNTKAFSEAFPDVDVHKNSMGTMLYYPNNLDKPTYCCSQCGGTNIQVQAWVNANTNEYVDDIGEGECWCENCQKHTTIREIK